LGEHFQNGRPEPHLRDGVLVELLGLILARHDEPHRDAEEAGAARIGEIHDKGVERDDGRGDGWLLGRLARNGFGGRSEHPVGATPAPGDQHEREAEEEALA
jgi:hypothetical protein